MNGDGRKPWTLKMVSPVEPGIVCLDIERMIEFYTKVLGLKLVSDAETCPETSAKFGATPYGYRIVRLETPRGEKIKLVQPREGLIPEKQSKEWACERPGLAYITFVVESVSDVVKRFRETGTRSLSQEPVEVRTGLIAIFAKDPERNFLEFVEYSART